MWDALPTELCRAILFHLSLPQLRLVKTLSRAMATSCRTVLRSEAWQEVAVNQIALEAELKTQLRAYRLPLTVSVFSEHFPDDAPCIATVHRLKLARFDHHEKACSVAPSAWVDTIRNFEHDAALDEEHTVITDMCIEVHRVGICGSETTLRQALQEAMRTWGLPTTETLGGSPINLADALWPYQFEYRDDGWSLSQMWDASAKKTVHEVPLDHLLTRMEIATEVRKGKWWKQEGPHCSQNGFDYCGELDLLALCRLGSTILL